MKNCKWYLKSIGMVVAVFLIVAAMGEFSNSYARSKKFGSLKFNAAIISGFGSSAPLPTNMDVYFSGPADRPFAVIGIIKGTPFDPNIWRPISIDAENIGKWRHMIENYNDMLANPYFGYDILDPNGKVIGKWLSYQRNTVIKMTKGNKITVYTPDGSFMRGSDPQRIGP
ncbi:MAG: hypothetical protein IME97_09900 [Proteobacteria bacterium]|nr:hypothetical protein [Pseudomonadota bacterium]